MVTAETFRRTAGPPGVELVTWRDDDRCVVARLGDADPRWLQLADVVLCPAGTTCERVRAVLAALPGCLVAVTLDPRPVMAVRGLGELVLGDVRAESCALACYRSLVSGALPSASSLVRTWAAFGMRDRS